jgi:hypothetical protein
MENLAVVISLFAITWTLTFGLLRIARAVERLADVRDRELAVLASRAAAEAAMLGAVKEAVARGEVEIVRDGGLN